MNAADACGNLKNVRAALDNAKRQKDGSITAAFKSNENGKPTYSNRQHDKAHTRSVTNIITWNTS